MTSGTELLHNLNVTRAITLKEPWASAVVFGEKSIENRTWAPPTTIHGKRIAIHAGAAFEESAREFMRSRRLAVPRGPFLHGYITGTAKVVGVLPPLSAHRPRRIEWYVDEVFVRVNTRWHLADHFGWILSDVRPLKVPIPARGAQGIWFVEKGVQQ